MGRRQFAHDYSRPCIYHITIHVAEGMGQPLGEVVGTDADNAAVCLTQAGAQVEHELLTAITTHYEMITVDTHVIMPDHLHFILNVRAPIISKNGRPTHLGQVMAGFKAGCNRAFWAATGGPAAKPQGALTAAADKAATTTAATAGARTPAAKPQGALTAAADTAATTTAATATAATAGATAGATAASAPLASSASSGFAAGNGAKKARYATGRAPLFAPGYCDVMPIEPGQLETQRAYIRNNPRSRWLRSHDRARLQTQRGGIDTAVTPAALRGYLQRECPRQFSAEAFALIEGRLLKKPGAETAGGPAQTIACDSYGDRALLERRLLPVVCHRSDKARFNEQKARCLQEAERGAVLVSPRIAPGEQAIIDEAVNRGFAVILIADNGFPEIYHPSTERINRCADGGLLMVTPWQYHYRRTDEDITVMECKTMNCVAQALCRTRDDWWK